MTIRYANYAREKSRFGGYCGCIIMHSTPGVGVNNDPNTAIFKDNLPAGYLKCDGTVKSAKDFYALSQILGVGDDCRFKKEGVLLRNADVITGDLGQFQLPDLGSKVIIPSRATGTYVNDKVEGETATTSTNRVGPQIEVVSNVGNRIEANYIGNVQVSARTDIDFNGNARYIMTNRLTDTVLSIENFQGHAHNSSQSYLNFSASHAVGSVDGKDGGNLSGNSGAGNVFDEAQVNTSTPSVHSHAITKPVSYNPNPFKYAHAQFNASMENVVSYVDVDIQNQNKLDQVVTPFILVEYLIKY